ncbi:MAG TPA: phosphoribosylformylglycinamidine synthase subunit PurS [Bacteroidota bacterium]|nr:phosphoribosylformylglycinamidine synthase subunit PurS [Bacteroidota bacterium]
MVYHAKVIVTLRKSILDPQGKAVEHGIHSLGYTSVENVRIGKFIEFDIDVPTQAEAEKVCREVSDKLLANPVMEDFTFVIEKKERSA